LFSGSHSHRAPVQEAHLAELLCSFRARPVLQRREGGRPGVAGRRPGRPRVFPGPAGVWRGTRSV